MPDLDKNRPQFLTVQTRAPVFCKVDSKEKTRGSSLSKRNTKRIWARNNVGSVHFKNSGRKVFEKRQPPSTHVGLPGLLGRSHDNVHVFAQAAGGFISPKLESETLVGNWGHLDGFQFTLE